MYVGKHLNMKTLLATHLRNGMRFFPTSQQNNVSSLNSLEIFSNIFYDLCCEMMCNT